MLEMRTSERGSLKRCAQQWYWGQVEGLRPNRTANPLWFGTATHEGLAQWYLPGLKRGPHPAETFEKFLDGERQMIVTNDDEEMEYVDARALGIDMLTRYVNLYGKDPSWHVIAIEKKGAVVLPRPEMQIFGRTRPAKQRWLRYNFTWDGVYRDLEDGQVKLMEHKSAASIQIGHLPLDDQAGSYWAVASGTLVKQGLLKPKEEIVGITYNFLRKALQDERPRNAEGYYTNKPIKAHYVEALASLAGSEPEDDVVKRLGKLKVEELDALARDRDLVVLGDVSASQPPAYFERHMVYRARAERKMQIERIQNEAVFAEAYREGYLPITKAPDKQHCTWCPYRRMCELDEQGDQAAVEEFKATQYHHEDPYGVYKKSAG